MIKLCEHPECKKPGTCRAPKTRELKEYWHFCQEHAAEYNKNWNYYDGMTDAEMEADWESRVFGAPLKEPHKTHMNADDYVKFINQFLSGRDTFDRTPAPKRALPSPVITALKIFDLPVTASWSDISARFRALAKQYHPDTAQNKADATIKFTQISNAYELLKQHFGKN